MTEREEASGMYVNRQVKSADHEVQAQKRRSDNDKERIETGKASINEIRSEYGLPKIPCELADKLRKRK